QQARGQRQPTIRHTHRHDGVWSNRPLLVVLTTERLLLHTQQLRVRGPGVRIARARPGKFGMHNAHVDAVFFSALARAAAARRSNGNSQHAVSDSGGGAKRLEGGAMTDALVEYDRTAQRAPNSQTSPAVDPAEVGLALRHIVVPLDGSKIGECVLPYVVAI